MSLRRIAVENYRCFRDRQELEIAPVTVVLGKNNSGKSALVRAPLIFATGFDATTAAPVDLEFLGTESVDAFTDLIFEQNPHGKVRVEFAVDGEHPFDLAATIQHVDETSDAFVSDLAIATDDVNLTLAWEPSLPTLGAPHAYLVSSAGAMKARQLVDFRGLIPVAASPPELRRIQSLPLSLGPMRYLGSYRERLPRQHRLPLGAPHDLGTQGEGLPGILAHDRARAGGELIALVNRHLQKIVPGWELDEVPLGPLFATVLTRRSSQGLQVNLADAGAGLAQVLPILVQCALDELNGTDGREPLQVIEEPEMHLHPAAHAELADLYLRTASTTKTRFLVETHSETLLLRLRRRIAEGDYPPDMVGIYVVEQRDGVSTVRRVGIDNLGNLGGDWPEGYFSQDYHEVRALASAQLERSGDVA